MNDDDVYDGMMLMMMMMYMIIRLLVIRSCSLSIAHIGATIQWL
jgi:hypothetical protein